MAELKTIRSVNFTDCQDLAFHDIPEIAYDYKIDKVTLDSKFEKTNNIEMGTRVVYFKDNEPIHYSLGTNRGTLISKLGIGGHIIEYKPNDLPPQYEYDSMILYNIPLKEKFNLELKLLIE